MSTSKGDMELADAECYNCGNVVGNYMLPKSHYKAPIVIKASGWIVCMNCKKRWRP